MTALKEESVGEDAVRRLAHVDWADVRQSLDGSGFAVVRSVFDRARCESVRDLYRREDLFRSRVVMARHGFGLGEYQYFGYPLPPFVARLRQALYEHLSPVATAWAQALGSDVRYPPTLDAFLAECHAQGQMRPTPLLLKYGAGDFNRLHQDIYGSVQFPLQAAVLLSAPGDDFEGGEFVMSETAPRKQTRVEVAPLRRGDMVVFAVNNRPQKTAKGYARVAMRHGVSTIRSGTRMTLGIILHDAT